MRRIWIRCCMPSNIFILSAAFLFLIAYYFLLNSFENVNNAIINEKLVIFHHQLDADSWHSNRNFKGNRIKTKILSNLNANRLECSYLNLDSAFKYNPNLKNNKCTMQTCFNRSNCDENNFRVFIYNSNRNNLPISKIYKSILNVFTDLGIVTTNANEACLFVVGDVDTLDRDKLSVNFLKDLNSIVKNLTHWRMGRNHLIFNMYSGSWPNYVVENMEFNSSQAILVKTSFSVKNYRKNFDISFPLFHQDLPRVRKQVERDQRLDLHSSKKKYFLTFKGKRYLHGVGTETRNALFHLNNDRDVILLTTCKHGTNWQELKDERCDVDNKLYEKFDYNDLLYNSVFCLIPRGRRLATYRFLESLKAGCIPVLLSNSWVLPFSEVIDWQKAVVRADERLLTQILPTLRRIPAERVMEMKTYGIFFYYEYFASVEQIVHTAIAIIKERVFKHTMRDKNVWNKYPGVFNFSNFVNKY